MPFLATTRREPAGRGRRTGRSGTSSTRWATACTAWTWPALLVRQQGGHAHARLRQRGRADRPQHARADPPHPAGRLRRSRRRSARCCTPPPAATRSGSRTRCCGAGRHAVLRRILVLPGAAAAARHRQRHHLQRQLGAAGRAEAPRGAVCRQPGAGRHRRPEAMPGASWRRSAPGWAGTSGCSGAGRRSARPRRLRCVAEWRSREAGSGAGFGQDSAGMLLELAAGLPGRVWALETPIHIADLTATRPARARPRPRRTACAARFAFPIMDGHAAAARSSSTAAARSRWTTACWRRCPRWATRSARRWNGGARGRAARKRAAEGAILASAPDCVITIDADGRILEFNATAERPSAARRDVLGHDLDETIFPAETQATHRRAFARALDGDTA